MERFVKCLTELMSVVFRFETQFLSNLPLVGFSISNLYNTIYCFETFP